VATIKTTLTRLKLFLCSFSFTFSPLHNFNAEYNENMPRKVASRNVEKSPFECLKLETPMASGIKREHQTPWSEFSRKTDAILLKDASNSIRKNYVLSLIVSHTMTKIHLL